MTAQTTTPTSALLIKRDGVAEVQLDLANTLACTRKHIGAALVDVVSLTSRYDMWIDEEGLYNHEVNPPATLLARSFGFVFQPYHGPVLITGYTPDGDTIGLTSEQMAALLKRFAGACDILV